jgi:metal transporter CNNM
MTSQCLLLDPGDAVPVRSLPLHKVPCVAQNEPLLGILDKFQEGRSHMAIVTRTSIEKASSLKKAVKKSITQRIKSRVGISDSSSEGSSEDELQSSRSKPHKTLRTSERSNPSEDSIVRTSDRDGTLASEATSDKDEGGHSFSFRRKCKRSKKRAHLEDVEMGVVKPRPQPESQPRPEEAQSQPKKPNLVQFALTSGLEQNMPADAVLTEEGANEVRQVACVKGSVLTCPVVSSRF